MEAFFKEIADYFLNFISQYSYFLNGDYYGGLFLKYFSVGGFIIGFIFVLLYCFAFKGFEKINLKLSIRH